MRRVPEIAKEMWMASPLSCATVIAVRILTAIFPVAILGVGGALIDALNHIQRNGGTLSRIWMLVAAEGVLVASTDSLSRLGAYCDLSLTNRFSLEMNLRLIRHCNMLDLETIESAQFQDRLERAKVQISSQVGLLRTLLQISQQIIAVTGLIGSAFLLAPGLIGVQLLGVLPVVFSETKFAAGRYHLNRGRTANRRLLDYLIILATTPQNAKEVRLFGLGAWLVESYKDVGGTYNREDQLLAAKQSATANALVILGALVYYAAYSILIFRTAGGLLTLGKLFFLAGLLERTRYQLSALFMGFSRSLDDLMNVRDVFEVFDQQPDVSAPLSRQELPRRIVRGVEFRNVSFCYAGSSVPVLQDVSFHIAPGERIALVGQNGAGKSTLIKLLTRLHDPTTGGIFLDGINIREFDPDSFRHQITAVFQDFARYDLSVTDNIGFGDLATKQDASRIARAALDAGALHIVQRLPKQYRQILGKRFENGVDLSGGEWQRLALARAAMRDAQVFILDEPSSSMDARAEAALFHDFGEMVAGRIAVLISHRFSTVRMADRILVLENGRIREEGSHEQLLASGGEYAQLFELQAAGYR